VPGPHEGEHAVSDGTQEPHASVLHGTVSGPGFAVAHTPVPPSHVYVRVSVPPPHTLLHVPSCAVHVPHAPVLHA